MKTDPTDPTTFLVRQLEHRHSVLIVKTSERTLVMTVFFSDAGCIGLQGFLEDPMWSRASSQDKTPVVIANMMTDPTTFLVRQLEHRQHSSSRHSNYDAINPTVGILQLRCSAV